METLTLNIPTIKPLKPKIHSLKFPIFPSSSRIYSNYSNREKFSFTISCKIKQASKDKTKNDAVPNKVVVPGAAPLLSEENGNAGNGAAPVEPPRNKKTGWLFLKRLSKKVLAVLSNLPLANGEMFVVAGLTALGTAIDQGEAPEYYFQKFPEDNPVLGFFTWRWVLTLGFDRMFSSPVFLGTLILLGASLTACAYTTQIPMVKVARRWSFLHSANAIRKLEFTDSLPRASIHDLGVVLSGAGYEGLAGRFAPIGVHIALLLVMAGGTLSATGSFRGSVTVPQGLNFVMGDVLGPSGFLSTPTDVFNTEVHVNRFYMDYYDSGEVSQFHTDLSLFDIDGKVGMRKTISVNDPLWYGGVTIYLTDWR